MSSRTVRVLLTLVTLAALSCASGPAPAPPPPRVEPLRVVTTSQSPPYAFRRAERLEGLEIDLARELGRIFGRPVEVVDTPWELVFNKLLDGTADIAMAGLTVTRARQTQVAFGTPYLETSIAALIRRRDAQLFRSRDAVCSSPLNVGVVQGTTGQMALEERCPAIIPRLYPTVRDAVLELGRRRIDAVVHDAPVLIWLQSQEEGDLQVVPTRVGNQALAWAFRPEDTALRANADAALATMRADGTLDRILARWVPGQERLRAE